MAELTVALRFYNDAEPLGTTIESVLAQREVDFELIVIDDGSTDTSAAIARAYKDPRLSYVETGRERGTGYCYDMALSRSRSDFFLTLRAGCVLLPGAFRTLLDAFHDAPKVGVVHGNGFEVDPDNRATRDKFRAQLGLFQEIAVSQAHFHDVLLRHGSPAHHLCAYRKSALATVGGFDKRLSVETDYDIALRITDRFTVKSLAEFLYCWHRPDDQKEPSPLHQLLKWSRRIAHFRALVRARKISQAPDRKAFQTSIIKGFCEHSRLAAGARTALGRLEAGYWRCRIVIESKLYNLLVAALSHCQLAPSTEVRALRQPGKKRIAYYTWHFPVLSQTFINRELAALKQAGIEVAIIADEPEEPELADDNAKAVMEQTHYLEPIDSGRIRRYHRHFLRASLRGYLNVFLFVISRRYGSYKTIHEDVAVFARAVYLAGIAQEQQIDHLHAPWSDRCAFVAMLAARLAGLTYSVQARAHDIHRHGYLFTLAEKFEPAQFIVTNTRYNESYMKTFLNSAHWHKLKVIHNGLDLPRFQPQARTATADKIRLLCVARLIEQKGLTYLLAACAALRDQGFSLDCEIVGGTEDIFMNYYLEFKRLRKQLGLESIVRLSGSLPFKDVLARYAQADIFVLPCVIAADNSRDITPNALIEAMAMKLPVVSTTVTGVPEIVEQGVSGILVPPNDKEALTEAIRSLIRDPGLRERLGEQARRRVEQKFDINKNVTDYVRLFSGEEDPAIEAASLGLHAQPVLLHRKGHHA